MQGTTLNVTIVGNNVDFGSTYTGCTSGLTLSNFFFMNNNGDWFAGNTTGIPPGCSSNTLYGDVMIPSNQVTGDYDLYVNNMNTNNGGVGGAVGTVGTVSSGGSGGSGGGSGGSGGGSGSGGSGGSGGK